MKTPIERLENDIAFAGKGPVVVRARDLRALIAAHKALREAAGALMVELTEPESHLPICRCGALATQYGHNDNVPIKDLDACDRCSGWLVRPSEYDHAAPLRALRAALKEEP